MNPQPIVNSQDFGSVLYDTEIIDESAAPGGTIEGLLEPSLGDIDAVPYKKCKIKNQAHRISILAEIEAEVSINRQQSPVQENGIEQVVCDDQEPCSSEDEKEGYCYAQEAVDTDINLRTCLVDDQELYKDLRQRKKHVFVLSEAGKPIYSRYCDDASLSPLIGLMHALVSFVEATPPENNELRYLMAGRWSFCFLHHSPLIFVAASQSGHSSAQLRQLLNLVYNHILSLLTKTRLCKIFDDHKNYDLRRLLTNTDKEFENLIRHAEVNPAYLLSAVKCLNMSWFVRDSLNQTVANCIGKNSNIVFAIILVKNQLVAMSRMKKYALHPMDLELLINLTSCNESYKNAELWIPICLPRLDNSGFLHAHISRLTEIGDACLILLTVDKSSFFSLSQLKSNIVDKLTRSKTFQPFLEACVADRGIRLSEMQIIDMWHFLYKNRTSSQFIYPDFEIPYLNEESRQRLSLLYLKMHDFMHTDDSQMAKIVFVNGDKESLLGWVTANFELYAAFSPFTLKSVAIGNVDKLMKWLKKEEDHLFILNPVLLS